MKCNAWRYRDRGLPLGAHMPKLLPNIHSGEILLEELLMCPECANHGDVLA